MAEISSIVLEYVTLQVGQLSIVTTTPLNISMQLYSSRTEVFASSSAHKALLIVGVLPSTAK